MQKNLSTSSQKSIKYNDLFTLLQIYNNNI